jgi:hypothetical protein
MKSLTSNRRGFSVRLFLPGGDPDGVKIIEKSNWNGAGLMIPRALFAQTRERPELQRAGVYLLVGPDNQSTLPMLYVGEGDPVGPRLDSHAKTKDFWTHLVAFTSKDQALNKAHVQYLESQLLSLARVAKRCTLDNGNNPTDPSLSEADMAEADGFLADVLLCLPVLGYGFFESFQEPVPSAVELTLVTRNLKAHGYESSTGFVVRHGSQASKSESDYIHDYQRDLRTSLVAQGVLLERGDYLEFTQDYTFGSPSTASSVIIGRPSNGRELWKTRDGQTLKQIQEREVVS